MKNINLNMQLGKAKSLKQDINFFEAAKTRARAGNTDLKSIIICGICFFAVIAVAFGGLKLAAGIYTSKTASINEEIGRAEIQDVLAQVSAHSDKNDLLYKYITLIRGADKSYEELNKPGVETITAIANATPAGVTIANMSVTIQEIVLDCSSPVFTDASLYMQRLEATKKFTHVSFNDVVFNGDSNAYTFTVSCVF